MFATLSINFINDNNSDLPRRLVIQNSKAHSLRASSIGHLVFPKTYAYELRVVVFCCWFAHISRYNYRSANDANLKTMDK